MSRWDDVVNGNREAYWVVMNEDKTFGPYTTQLIAAEIRGLLAELYPADMFKITSRLEE